MADLELTRDLRNIDCFAFEGEGGIARYDMERRNLLRSVMMSSLIPSLKYSCSASPLMLANGRTQMEKPSSLGRTFSGADHHSTVVQVLPESIFPADLTCPHHRMVEIKNVNAFAVFHFHFTQIMQMWPPSSVLLEIFATRFDNRM